MSDVDPPTPLGRRERKKAATRRLISDAATRQFRDRGFDNVTVKQIADEADVSPTTVFKHFPSKESLAFDEEPDQEVSLVRAVRDRGPSQTVLDALEEHLLGGRLLSGHDNSDLSAFLALVDDTPALRDYERRMLLRRESAVAKVIASSTQEALSAAQALGVARFVLQAADIARDRPDPRQAFTELMAMLRSGCHV
ncbi:MAG: TetR/AcrR family transcriptional regulator [Janthinobacterium lividum]